MGGSVDRHLMEKGNVSLRLQSQITEQIVGKVTPKPIVDTLK